MKGMLVFVLVLVLLPATAFAQFASCRLKLSKSDANGDGILSPSDFGTFIQDISESKTFLDMDSTTRTPIHQSYDVRYNEDLGGMDLRRADEFVATFGPLEQFCANVYQAFFPAFQVDITKDNCFSAVSMATLGNGRISKEDYVSLVNTLVDDQFMLSSYRELRHALRDVYSDFAEADSGIIESVSTQSSNGMTNFFTNFFCRRIVLGVALDDAFYIPNVPDNRGIASLVPPETIAPSKSPVLVTSNTITETEYLQCTINMLAVDISERDDQLNELEFVEFINQYVDYAFADLSFSELPEIYQNLYTLALQQGDGPVFSIKGALPPASDAQATFLRDFCADFYLALEEWKGSENLASSVVPSELPSEIPSQMPSQLPIDLFSLVPSKLLVRVPTQVPSRVPTQIPTKEAPSEIPSQIPSQLPTNLLSMAPSKSLVGAPTQVPSRVPIQIPIKEPTMGPTRVPTYLPSQTPTQPRPQRLSTSAPTPQIATEELISETIYSVFDVINEAGKWLMNDISAMTSAYEAFIQNILDESSVRRRIRGRKLAILGMNFAQIEDLEAIECPEQVVGFICSRVIASFGLLLSTEQGKDDTVERYTTLIQKAIDDGELQAQIELYIPDNHLSIFGRLTPNSNETPSLNPTQAPQNGFNETFAPTINMTDFVPKETDFNVDGNEMLAPTEAPVFNSTDGSASLVNATTSTTNTPSSAPITDWTPTPTADAVTKPLKSIYPSVSPILTNGPTERSQNATLSPEPPVEPISLTLNNVQIELSGVGFLDAAAQETFVHVTSAYYRIIYADGERRRHLQSLEIVQGTIEFNTSLSILDQHVQESTNTIYYVQEIMFYSKTNASAIDFIQEPFLDTSLILKYVDMLKRSSDAFANLTSVTVPTVEELSYRGSPIAYDDSSQSLSGVAVAGIVLAILVLFANGGIAIRRNIMTNKRPRPRRIVRVGTMLKDSEDVHVNKI